MSKHTPGVWVADKTVDGKHHIVTLPDGRIAAYCGYIGAHDDAESLANARLIAAAPELLEALMDLCGLMKIRGQDKGGSYESAMRVIAKATGEQ